MSFSGLCLIRGNQRAAVGKESQPVEALMPLSLPLGVTSSLRAHLIDNNR